MAAATAGFMTHVSCRLTAKNRDQLRNRVWATFLLSVATTYRPNANERELGLAPRLLAYAKQLDPLQWTYDAF